jgi:hypothetical protein
MDLDTIFANMEKASISDKGAFFGPGLYLLQVESLEYRNGYKGESFIAKFKVLGSDNDEHGEGVTRSWIVKLDKPKTKVQVMGEIKSLFFSLLGVAPKDVPSPDKDPKAHADIVAMFKCAVDETYARSKGVDPKAFIGKKVRLEATTVKTAPSPERPTGGEFTRHAWSPA